MIILKGDVFKRWRLALVGTLVFACNASYASEEVAGSAFAEIQNRLVSIYENNKDAVVKISAEKLMSDGKVRFDTCGGFITNKDGHILTSAFVTYDAKRIWVEWKGLLLEAENIGYDPLTTVSVIKIKGDFKSKNASFIQIDSNPVMPSIASPALLISREIGLAPSPRMGLVSGHDINFGDVFLPTVYLRTNIPSHNGSIGSPAFDLNGKFVGMMLASLPATNGSFLLPARAATRIRDDIIISSEPVYGWFGIQAKDDDDTQRACVSVSLVIKGSPGDKAGVLVGDVILEVNSQSIENNTQLRNITFFARPGDTVTFKIKRGDKIQKLNLLVEKMDPEVIKAAAEKFKLKLPDEPKNKEKANEADKAASTKF